MTTRLLCTGDLHLGRRSGHLPSTLGRGELAELTPVAAWRAIVQYALDHEVDALLLTGDVVESEEDYFEALGPLDEGVRRLAGAGIEVFAVAGNHDVKVLPRLAASIPQFHLLGADGEWEEAALVRDGEPRVALLGWSFPERIVRENPLASLPAAGADGLPLIGLLHCDRDAPGSTYAPVRGAELAASRVDAWLLGHIHKPDALAGPRPIGYLGSALALDPDEIGMRGPWLMEVRAKDCIEIEHVPLAPLRWELLRVDVSGLAGDDELASRLSLALPELHEALREELGGTRIVGCRILLEGCTPSHAGLRRWLATCSLEDMLFRRDEVSYFVDRVSDATRPERDLQHLALGNDPPALLARKLLALERDAGDAERRRLIRGAREGLAPVLNDPAWVASGRGEPGDEVLRDHLWRMGMLALELLLEQQGEEL